MKTIAWAVVGTVVLLGQMAAQVRTYCSNIAGSISCTSYGEDTGSRTYCSSIAGDLTCTTYSDSDNRVQMVRNFETGQIIGTALGNVIMGAIAEYRAGKRQHQEKKDEWHQFVQDTLAAVQLNCEQEPGHTAATVLGCRRTIFVLDDFLQRHPKDFVPDGKNVSLLAAAIEKLGIDESTMTPEMLDSAFRTIPKNQLDKKPHLGMDGKGKAFW